MGGGSDVASRPATSTAGGDALVLMQAASTQNATWKGNALTVCGSLVCEVNSARQRAALSDLPWYLVGDAPQQARPGQAGSLSHWPCAELRSSVLAPRGLNGLVDRGRVSGDGVKVARFGLIKAYDTEARAD